jgi:hypothetical protein
MNMLNDAIFTKDATWMHVCSWVHSTILTKDEYYVWSIDVYNLWRAKLGVS